MVFVEALDSMGQSIGGGWEEKQILGTLNDIEIYNNGTTPIYLPQVGIRFSTTSIPLEQLNRTDMPPNSFNALSPVGVTPGPHGIQINPGQSVGFTEQKVPALSSIAVISLILMAICLGFFGLRKRTKTR